MLRLADRWVWDSWLVEDGERYHLFFLQAPRSLVDPTLRHTRATVGHATSTDLLDWQLHPDALGPSADGWDDLAIWTGSVLRADANRWLMFYTALSDRGHGVKDQRIGMAESADLYSWNRIGTGPVVEVDPRWYKTSDADPGVSETWRDPFVFADPDGDGWHMLITARDPHAARFDDGVLGHARSTDLRHWQVGPPLAAPAGFGQIEVPQVRLVDGRPLLVFTCHPEEQSAARTAEYGRFSTWSVPGPSLTGPWDLSRAVPIVGEPDLFAAQLIRRRDGQWVLVGFRNVDPEGAAFEIIDPVPVRLGPDGLIS